MSNPLCKCGCGQEVSKLTNEYIFGHYFKGRKRGPMSQDQKRKIKEGTIKAYENEEVRERHKLNTPRGKNHCCYGTEGYWKDRNHTEETKHKMCLSQQGKKHHFYGKKHKETTKKKTSYSMKKWWNTIDGVKQRQKQSNKMKEGQAAYANSFITNPSKPQVELFNKVKKIFNSAILNYPFFSYSLDIAIPEKRLVIEYDGSYWHNDKDYDKRRQNYLERHGWKFLRYVDKVPSFNELNIDILKILKERIKMFDGKPI